MHHTTTSFYPGRNYHLILGITLSFGLLAAFIGPALRYTFIGPVGFNYRNLLHAHSHTMLMGWLFNGFILAMCRNLLHRLPASVFTGLLLTSIPVALLLVLFPSHGYDGLTIGISTVYVLFSYYTCYGLYTAIDRFKDRQLSYRLVKTAIFFHVFSTLWLFSLGPVMARGFGHTAWYPFIIQSYLHFQYDGFLWFAFLALLSGQYGLTDKRANRFACLFMVTGTFLLTGYVGALAFKATWMQAAGFAGGFLQVAAAFILLTYNHYRKPHPLLMMITTLAMLKLVLQLAGAIPALSGLLLNSRPVLVAWLHFIFLGIYTPLLWFLLRSRKIPGAIWIGYWTAFFIAETVLLLPDLLYKVNGTLLPHAHVWNFTAAVGLCLAFAGISVSVMRSYWINYRKTALR